LDCLWEKIDFYVSMIKGPSSLVKLFGLLLLLMREDRLQAAGKDQKRYNREILYHYPIVPLWD